VVECIAFSPATTPILGVDEVLLLQSIESEREGESERECFLMHSTHCFLFSRLVMREGKRKRGERNPHGQLVHIWPRVRVINR